MFKRHWFPIIDIVPAHGIRWVRAWDLAATEQKTKDTTTGPAYTAGVLLGRDYQGMFYVKHAVRIREGGLGVYNCIRNTAEQDGSHVEIDMPQDPGQAGKTQAAAMVSMLAGFKAFASPETGSKETRAEPLAAQAEAGNIKIVRGPWNEEFLSELETFPASKYKDQVDALSRAFARHIRVPYIPLVAAVVVSGGPRNIPGS
jgi:predicted phage terminase large subunit-like protein